MLELDRNLYTVAWIAPLYIEAKAALLMLDQKHRGQFVVSRGDDYVFHAGSIGGHNVVIATLPAGQEYGTGSAAALASQLRKSFPNLWFGLLVGIAAGLPNLSCQSPRDIRLGDVLVALPDGDTPGLVAYDLGKDTGDDGFKPLRLGHVLAQTETIVRSAIGKIRLNSINDVQPFLSYYRQLREKRYDGDKFKDPGQDRDILYEFDKYGNEHMVPRKPRSGRGRTRVWYGPIGSGEKLMRNARQRNELRDRYNIIGLEMEAAGTMNRIPVGVIRGVCDYGDEHKSKEWQPYAAAMAAAYAKAVLREILPDGQDSLTFTASEGTSAEGIDRIQQNHFLSRFLDSAPYKSTKKRPRDDSNSPSRETTHAATTSSSICSMQSRETKWRSTSGRLPSDTSWSKGYMYSNPSLLKLQVDSRHHDRNAELLNESWPELRTERPGLSAKYIDRWDTPHQFLADNNSWHAPDRKTPWIVVVYGLSGVGKSQMCLKAITTQEHRSVYDLDAWCLCLTNKKLIRYRGIFYVDASNKATADANFIDISRVCKVQHHWESIAPDEQIRITRAWLACQKDPWLLMIDNADSSDLNLDTYIPTGGPGTILITTTDERLATCGHIAHRLGSLSDDEAFNLLLKYTNPDGSRAVDQDDIARTLATQVLGGLPLAIAHAGSYIFNNHYTYAEYLEEFQECPRDLLDANISFRQLHQQRPVWSTLALSIRRIEVLPDRGSTEAVELLRTMSFLHNEGIHDRLFQQAWVNMKNYPSFSKYVTFLDPSTRRWDTPVIRAAVGILCRYSLINPASSSKRQYSMHKIVQTICRDSLGPDEQLQYSLKATSLMAAALSGIKTPLSWIDDPAGFELQKFMLPHIKSCVTDRLETNFTNCDDLVAAEILLTFAKAYSATGHYEDAECLLEKGLGISNNKGFDKSQKSIFLKLMEQKATCQAHFGKHRLACGTREEILRIRKLEGPTSSDDRCVAMMNLSESFWALGKQQDALSMSQKCLRIREKNLPPNDPRLARTRRKVAEFLHALSHKRCALQLRELVFREAEEKTDRTHIELLDYLSTKSALADSYQWDGRFLIALELRQDVYEGRNNILGPEHPETLLAHDKLLLTRGALTNDRDEHLKICQQQEKSVIIWKRTFGDLHPYTLEARVHLGRSYRRVGDFSKALDEQEGVLHIRKREFEKDPGLANAHILAYMSSMNNVASLFRKTNQLYKALDMRRQVVKLAESHFGANHPVTFNALNRRLNCEAAFPYTTVPEIRGMREEILAKQKVHFQANDPSILKTMSYLAVDLEVSAPIALAVETRKTLLAAQQITLGPHSRETIDNMKRLARILPLGQDIDSSNNEATKLFEEVRSIEGRLLGWESFQVQHTTAQLARKVSLHRSLSDQPTALRGLDPPNDWSDTGSSSRCDDDDEEPFTRSDVFARNHRRPPTPDDGNNAPLSSNQHQRLETAAPQLLHMSEHRTTYQETTHAWSAPLRTSPIRRRPGRKHVVKTRQKSTAYRQFYDDSSSEKTFGESGSETSGASETSEA